MRSKNQWFIYIFGIYMACVSLANILAVKTFGSSTFSVTSGGTLLSWVVFSCIDIIAEVWGKREAIRTYLFGAVVNLAFTGISWIGILIPSANTFVSDAYKTVLGTGWRICVCSVTAFLLGNYINVHVLTKIKGKEESGGSKKRGFTFRAIVSTIIGQIVDNFVFYGLAFAPAGISGTIEYPWVSILQIGVCTTVLETVLEWMICPIMSRIVRRVRESCD